MPHSILSAIGRTPLIELRRIVPGRVIHAKLEMLNLTGSAKDRSGRAMILEALETGKITPGGTVVESSSGNMGLALAQACLYHQIRFICVVDERTSPRAIDLLRAYGTEVEMVRRGPGGDEKLLEDRLRRVEEVRAAIPGCYWTNQYANPANAAAHRQTMEQIAYDMDDRVDYCFVATSTCGTLAGCVDYARSRRMATRFVAVDACGSVTFGGTLGPRRLPGHGISITPSLYRPDLASEVFRATDADCVAGCRRLRDVEAVFAGASSGAVVTALIHLSAEIPPDASIAVILHDHGNRYIDTVYSDSWAKEVCGWDG